MDPRKEVNLSIHNRYCLPIIRSLALYLECEILDS